MPFGIKILNFLITKKRTRRRGRRVTSSTEDTESVTETEDSSNEEIKVHSH